MPTKLFVRELSSGEILEVTRYTASGGFDHNWVSVTREEKYPGGSILKIGETCEWYRATSSVSPWVQASERTPPDSRMVYVKSETADKTAQYVSSLDCFYGTDTEDYIDKNSIRWLDESLFSSKIIGYNKKQMKDCWEAALNNHYNCVDHLNKVQYIDSIIVDTRQGYTSEHLEKMWDAGIAHERYYTREENGEDLTNEPVPQKCNQIIASLTPYHDETLITSLQEEVEVLRKLDEEHESAWSNHLLAEAKHNATVLGLQQEVERLKAIHDLDLKNLDEYEKDFYRLKSELKTLFKIINQ